MKKGDLITGIDRRYIRSIYRYEGEIVVGGLTFLKAIFISFDGFRAEEYDESEREFPLEPHSYRLATAKEIEDSFFGPQRPCECASDTDRHSDYCPRFRRP